MKIRFEYKFKIKFVLKFQLISSLAGLRPICPLKIEENLLQISNTLPSTVKQNRSEDDKVQHKQRQCNARIK